MTHVVTERCIKCKYTDCVDVCPVDCFREGPNFLVIDPEECIDCGVCIPECPVEAIYADEDVPQGQELFIELNAELALNFPSITSKKAPLADAEVWKEVHEKRQYLDQGNQKQKWTKHATENASKGEDNASISSRTPRDP